VGYLVAQGSHSRTEMLHDGVVGAEYRSPEGVEQRQIWSGCQGWSS
jgi:hypothetical protein